MFWNSYESVAEQLRKCSKAFGVLEQSVSVPEQLVCVPE